MNRLWRNFAALASSNLGLRLFSFAFAVGLWLFVNVGQKPVEWPFKVPVEFRHVPAGIAVANPFLEEIEVRAMGPPALLSTIDPNELKVALDLTGARPGTSTFRVDADFFSPPRGVRITRISPSVIHLKLEPLVVRSLPVTVRFAGKPPPGYKVTRVEVTPESVEVKGPESEVARMASVETAPLEMEGNRVIVREVRLASAGKGLSFTPARVKVSVAVEEER